MRSADIEPKKSLLVSYSFSAETLAGVRVHANIPIDVMLVDGDGLYAFQNGKDFDSYGRFYNHTDHYWAVDLPPRTWHLIIQNNGDVGASVKYDVIS
jgi:hypothetical protein